MEDSKASIVWKLLRHNVMIQENESKVESGDYFYQSPTREKIIQRLKSTNFKHL